jgi:hypothetical protein
MPYMDMKEKTRIVIAATIYLITLLPLIVQNWIDFTVGLLSATTMPFIMFVVPGVLYYQHI